MLGHCHPGSKHYGSLYAGLCLGCSGLLVGLGWLSFRNLRDKADLPLLAFTVHLKHAWKACWAAWGRARDRDILTQRIRTQKACM